MEANTAFWTPFVVFATNTNFKLYFTQSNDISKLISQELVNQRGHSGDTIATQNNELD